VGPSLISQDLRFNAMPLYFAKPLRRLDYFAGKLGVIGVLLTMTMIGPAVLAYVLGVFFSLDVGVIPETARVLGAALLYGVIVVVSAGTLMLALSSLSRNSRQVGMLWIGLWWISYILAGVLGATVDRDWCPLVSYTHNLARVRHALLGTHRAWDQVVDLVPDSGGAHVSAIAAEQTRQRDDPAWFLIGDLHPWYWSAGVLAGLFVLSLWLLTFRVKSLDKLR
jgi:ABC-2 type transport system permease protein